MKTKTALEKDTSLIFPKGGLKNGSRVQLVTEVPVTRKLRPVEIDLEEEVQAAVLELPVCQEDGTLTTVGDLLRTARTALETANKAIQDNALIKVTSDHMMKKGKRRGTALICANLDGRVSLRITYGEAGSAPEPAPKSKLPTLGELRKQAAELDVDISDLGRQKHQIIKRLDGKRKETTERPVLQAISVDGAPTSQRWTDEKSETELKRTSR